MTPLPTEAPDFGDGHALNPGLRQGILDIFEFVVPENRFNLFHDR
jgi:hypothetical protein